MRHRKNFLRLALATICSAATGSTLLSAQYDGALSLNWGAGDGFATWDCSGEVVLEAAVATHDLLYGVGSCYFPAGTRNLHFQAVDRAGEVQSDRLCRDSTGAFGAFTDDSGGEAAILDASGNLLVGGWVTFEGAGRRHALIARYETDQPGCTLDESFSTDGFRLFDTQTYCDSESCQIVALGEIRPETGQVATPRTIALLRAAVAVSSYRYFLIGLTPTGSLDLNFGASSSGIREVGLAGLGVLRSGASLTIDPRGRIVVQVTRLEPGSASDLDTMALRFTARGTLDTSFSDDGVLPILDAGDDDAHDDVATDLIAMPAGPYFATGHRPNVVSIVRVDSDEQTDTYLQLGQSDAAPFVAQGSDRFLFTREDVIGDQFQTLRILVEPDYEFDATFGEAGLGWETYDLDQSGGTSQTIVDLLLWGGLPVVVGNAIDGNGDSWGFLMRAENAYIFADGFESGNRALWFGF